MNFMRKSIICLSIALLLLTSGLTLIPNTFCQLQNNVYVLNSKTTWHIDSEGYVEVVGEVENEGHTPIYYVDLSGSLLGASGTDITDGSCQSMAWYLLPGQTAPFSMQFTPISWAPSAIASFNVTGIVAPATDSYQYQGVTIVSSSPTVGTSGNFSGIYLVNGSIKNIGNLTAEQVSMVATFFDSAGSVVAIGYNTTPVAESLAPGATVPFQVPSYQVNQTLEPASLKISSYALSVIMVGPILNETDGTVPTPNPGTTQTSSPSTPLPTSSPSASSSSNSAVTKNSNGSPNSTLIALTVVIAVVAGVGIILALRRGKPEETVTEKPTRPRKDSISNANAPNKNFKNRSNKEKLHDKNATHEESNV